jgi:predicted DNA-binding transcriptional regulator AlpA
MTMANGSHGRGAAEVAPALLTWASTAAAVGVSQRTLRRMVAGRHFPDPVPVPGLAGRRFRAVDVQTWLAAR